MPISDAYIVQYLLDGTSEVPAQIHWREKDGEQVGYLAILEGVEVSLERFYSRTGSGFVLRLRDDQNEFQISEPSCGGWLGRKFSTDDQRHLARLFRELIAAIASQCSLCWQRAENDQVNIRERIAHRLLFGESRESSRRAVIAGPP